MSVNLIAFDFETTSAEPATARVVQTAWIHANENFEVLHEVNALSNPVVDIHHEAAQVHGITNEMVAGKPLDTQVIRGMIADWDDIEGDIILCVHNGITFDIPIADRLSGYYLGDEDVIDTLVLSTRMWPEAPNHKLADLVQWLGIDDGEGAHDALADIKMVLKLIQALHAKTGKTLQELAAECKIPYVHEICWFGKHKGKPFGKGPGRVPWFYINFCCEKFDTPSLDMQATFLYHYNSWFKCKGSMRQLPLLIQMAEGLNVKD